MWFEFGIRMIVPKRANMTVMAWFKAAIWIESRRGTENIYAVLHQRCISIQHEHMCEVLGAQQVFVKHPQLIIHSKQSWCSHSSQKTEGTAIKQRNTAAKAQMLFPIEILPFVVSGTGPWQTPLESDNSECLQVEDGTFQYISHNKTAKPKRQERRTCIFHHPLPGTYKQVSSHPSCHIPYVAIWSAEVALAASAKSHSDHVSLSCE